MAGSARFWSSYTNTTTAAANAETFSTNTAASDWNAYSQWNWTTLPGRPAQGSSFNAATARADEALKALLGAHRHTAAIKRGWLPVPSPSFPKFHYRIPLMFGHAAVFRGRRKVGEICGMVPNAPWLDTVIAYVVVLRANERLMLWRSNWFDADHHLIRNARVRPASPPEGWVSQPPWTEAIR